jgi:hypothetical protein
MPTTTARTGTRTGDMVSCGSGTYYVCHRSRLTGKITLDCPVPTFHFSTYRHHIDESNRNNPHPHFDRVLAYKERDSDPEFQIIYGPKAVF